MVTKLACGGADDPDCRKPMIWEEFNYNNEKAHQCDRRNDCDGQRPSDPVEINTELFNHYKQLNKLKSQYNVLNYGDYKTVYTDQNGLYIFSRSYDDQTILAIFNGAKTFYRNTFLHLGENQDRLDVIDW